MLKVDDTEYLTVIILIAAVAVIAGLLVWLLLRVFAKRRETALQNELHSVRSELSLATDRLQAPQARAQSPEFFDDELQAHSATPLFSTSSSDTLFASATVFQSPIESQPPQLPQPEQVDVESHDPSLSARCIELEKRLADEQDVLVECRAEIIVLNDTLILKEQRITLLEEEAREYRAQASLQVGEEDDYLIKGLKSNLAELRGKLPQMETRLHVGQGLTQDLQQQLQAERQEKAELLTKLESKDRHIHAVDVLLSSQKQDTAAARRAQSGAERNLQSAQLILEGFGHKEEELHEERDNVRQVKNARAIDSKLFSAKPSVVDDLKLLKGIGRKLERKLHGLGVYQFSQLAACNDDDLAWLDDKLSILSGQSTRDAWVSQAMSLIQNADT